MTGEEHAAEAERGIEASTFAYQRWGETQNDGDYWAAEWELRRAQVHAALAQAAYFAETLKVTRDAQDRADRVIASYQTLQERT